MLFPAELIKIVARYGGEEEGYFYSKKEKRREGGREKRCENMEDGKSKQGKKDIL